MRLAALCGLPLYSFGGQPLQQVAYKDESNDNFCSEWVVAWS